MNNKLKQKAKNIICERSFKFIYINSLQPTILMRFTNDLLPKLQQCNNDVCNILKTMTIKTNNYETFLLVNDKNSNISLLSCNTNLICFIKLNVIYVDVTFYKVHKTIFPEFYKKRNLKYKYLHSLV